MTVDKSEDKRSSRRISPDKISAGKSKPCIKPAEHEYQPTRSEFEQLAEASNDAIRIINNDFTIRYINRGFADIAGVNQNDVVGKKCWEVFPSSLCHTQECRACRVLNGEEELKVEIERQKPDGTIIPCIVSTTPLKNKQGNRSGVIEQFRDITEIRYREKEIKEAEDRYRALIVLDSEIGEAIVMLQDIDEKEGIQIFFNDQWTKITKYSKEELLGTSFFKLIHPSNRQASLDRHRCKMSGESLPGLYEMIFMRKDGTEFPAELTSSIIYYKSKKTNIVFLRDITQRKQAEKRLEEAGQRYRTLFENAPVGICEVDYSGAKEIFDTFKKTRG